MLSVVVVVVGCFCLLIYLFICPGKTRAGDDGCHFNATISVSTTSILHFYSRPLTGDGKVGPPEFPLRGEGEAGCR